MIAGHPIELVYGGSDSTPDKAVEEARRLVEQEGVDILVGPLSGSEGIAVAEYSKEQPGVTFVNGISGAQDTTLKVRSPNFFRFHNDGTQWTAGLGNYAYNELGWRNVVTIGDDYDFPYSQIAGFVAEFCSIGGNVTERLWPPLGEEDYSSYITQIPEDVDGFFMGVGGTGTVAFVKQYEQLRGNLADKIMGGIFMTDPVILKELGDQVVGVVTAGMTAGDSQEPAYLEYTQQIEDAYPDLAGTGSSVFFYGYYTAMEAIAQALEQVEGDLSNDHAALNDALANLRARSPAGDDRARREPPGDHGQLPPADRRGQHRRRRPRREDAGHHPGGRSDVRGRVQPGDALARPDEPQVRGGNASSVDGSGRRGLAPTSP